MSSPAEIASAAAQAAVSTAGGSSTDASIVEAEKANPIEALRRLCIPIELVLRVVDLPFERVALRLGGLGQLHVARLHVLRALLRGHRLRRDRLLCLGRAQRAVHQRGQMTHARLHAIGCSAWLHRAGGGGAANLADVRDRLRRHAACGAADVVGILLLRRRVTAPQPLVHRRAASVV